MPGFLPLAEPVAELRIGILAFFIGDRAFSAQLPKRLDTLLCFVGGLERPGVFSIAAIDRALNDLLLGVGRDIVLLLAEDGERTLEALLASSPVRSFFLGTSELFASLPFSLPSPEISRLRSLALEQHGLGKDIPNLFLLGGRPGPGREDAVA